MGLWTQFGLRRGSATTRWPADGGDDGQTGLEGMPRHHPAACADDCRACVDACLPGALQCAARGGLEIDYGRCIACRMCVDVCPQGAMTSTTDWQFAARQREDLRWQAALESDTARALAEHIGSAFRRSLHLRHVDAGSCNGCESELQALNNPFYNLHRLGIFFTPSPRFADVLLVTGPVTHAMREPLRAAYTAMPQPRRVLAIGTCAVSGGVAGGGYACGDGLADVLAVDVFVPGCPPNPAALIHALLVLLERTPQRVKGGRLVG